MPEIIKVAEATAGRNSRDFLMLDANGDPVTGLTDADITTWLIKDGTGAAGTGTCAEVDATNAAGLYTYTPSTTELAAGGACVLKASAWGSEAAFWPFQIINNDVYAASATKEEVADAFLNRNIAGGSSVGRLVKDALRVLRNKVAISGGTMTVYREDDSTEAWTAGVTTAAGNPLTEVDPA